MILPTKEFWNTFKKINGALSTAEALAITNIAAQAPSNGWACELGTHMGKSAMAAMLGLKTEFFMLLDPIFTDMNIITEIEHNISSVNEKIKLKYCSEYSTDFLPKLAPYAYVFVDSGSHGDGLPMQEAKLLEDNMLQGGIIAFHDYLNQFTEVEQSYDYLLSTGKYDKIDINWQEIFDYVAENNLEDNNTSWHVYPELPHPPNFVGALRRK